MLKEKKVSNHWAKQPEKCSPIKILCHKALEDYKVVFNENKLSPINVYYSK